ncbi:aspartate kinase [Vibrio aestuarianus]|uniref:aspartate kinase n=1 Tax=Vibrio aestuarianus TaxID=28171 RepID=UPI0006A5EAF0|nr:aspartate kinase [Vibrio aestuarianus]KOE81504.1 aspartate kinase [Vibrio alginolyticus]MDE1263496.1 aspartate kinase [Vibrio aestuarianus]MDE1295504.1 aspartate kinase [Vibrio aestuarianus]MDE1337114.1 aspartate kinase [Vibrio aestuarianus]
MSYTVEKIGGTSMSAFDAVLDNILLRPNDPYQRVFVVSAYATITDALLECKRTGKPGIYQMIAKHDAQWKDAIHQLEQRMLLINDNLFADPISRIRADKFIRSRIAEAVNCITNILETCQYGQFSLRHYLPQIREFLSSIGEAHSAYNTSLKLKTLGVNARFVDLSGWNSGQAGTLDEVILMAFSDIDVSTELPIVTGYAYCDEGLMKTYDRGYSEMTFSRIAALTEATQAIIHKEYHLSSADPRVVGPDKVSPMGLTNFDVADQLANLGMEAIHPNAAAGLRKKGIELRIKNTFEPEHEGTLITNAHQPVDNKVEIIAGRNKVFALHIFDQSMVGKIDNASYELMEVIADAKVYLVGKEMNANSMTYYLSGNSENLNHVLYKVEKSYPNASVSGKMVALISAIGASINANAALSQGMQALTKADVNPIAAHSSMRNVNAQFVVEDQDYNSAICALHQMLIVNKVEAVSSENKAAA